MLTFGNRDIYKVIDRNLGQGANRAAGFLTFSPSRIWRDAVKGGCQVFERNSQLVVEGVEVSGWVL